MWSKFFSRLGVAAAAAAATTAAGVITLQQQRPSLQQQQPLAFAASKGVLLNRESQSSSSQTCPQDEASANTCLPTYPVSPYPRSATWDSNWDAMAGGSRGGSRVRRILLVRHGRYHFKSRRLDDLGREQADLLGRRLAELHSRHGIARVVSSDVTRAVETANLALRHLPHLAGSREECGLLAEVSPCPPEPPDAQFHPEYRYHRGWAQVEAAFRRHLHRARSDEASEHGSIEVLICHANVIRYLVCRALQLPQEAWLRFSLDHCSITWLDIYPDGNVCLRSYSDSGYLPARCVTRANLE